MKEPLKVYLSGKADPAADWRNGVPGWTTRQRRPCDDLSLASCQMANSSRPENEEEAVEWGLRNHHDAALIRWLIQDCDVVFAWISSAHDAQALGEISFAGGIGKPIWMSFLPELELVFAPSMWLARDVATHVDPAGSVEEAWFQFSNIFPLYWDKWCRVARAKKWHDEFLATSARHRRPVDGHVYFLRAGDWVKIGKATVLDRRVTQLAIQLPFRAEIAFSVPCADIDAGERFFHEMFADLRGNGEWFAMSDELLDWVKQRFHILHLHKSMRVRV